MLFEFIDVHYKDVLAVSDLSVDAGITAVVGSSGGGKTTLLRLMNKIISPTHGRILYRGVDLKTLDSVAHRRGVVMLSQNPVMFGGSIRDNLIIGLQFQGRAIPDDQQLLAVLEQVHLKKTLESGVENLSGGEKQRLSIGRVLLLSPEVFLMDEPSSALDEATAELVVQMLCRLVRQNGQSMVLVTHSPNIAQEYADVILEIEAGRLTGRRG